VTRKKQTCQTRQCPGWASNGTSPEYTSVTLPRHSTWLGLRIWLSIYSISMLGKHLETNYQYCLPNLWRSTSFATLIVILNAVTPIWLRTLVQTNNNAQSSTSKALHTHQRHRRAKVERQLTKDGWLAFAVIYLGCQNIWYVHNVAEFFWELVTKVHSFYGTRTFIIALTPCPTPVFILMYIKYCVWNVNVELLIFLCEVVPLEVCLGQVCADLMKYMYAH